MMALLGYSRSLVRKTPEQIRDVQAMFDDVRAYLANGKLTGAQNFKVDTLAAGNWHNPLGAIDVSKCSGEITPFGVLGNVVGSYVFDINNWFIGPNSGLYSQYLAVPNVAAGDLLLVSFAWKKVSGSFASKGWGLSWVDGIAGTDVDSTALRTFVGNSFGWGPDSPTVAPISSAWYGQVVRAAPAQIQPFVNYDSAGDPLTLNARVRAILIRST